VFLEKSIDVTVLEMLKKAELYDKSKDFEVYKINKSIHNKIEDIKRLCFDF